MQVVIGRIGRAHGIRGELNVEVRTDEPERRFSVGSSVRCGDRTLTVARVRNHSGRLVVSFTQIGDRAAAEALRGQLLEAEVDPAEGPGDPDEFYDHQLIGLRARTGDHEIGTVTGIVHGPHQDILTVDVDGREAFIPFVTAIVPTVDVVGGFVIIDEIDGLLDPARAESAAEQDG